ncbi:FG-GAP-like repeat-containing protein [Streptomyces sporangiiformans]|uniref:Integrin-like protein n=1 Tax=Streptomyces sporangiiformans TaxID=2315329 RepID=A0A505DG85_9ACTN|nr:FG-GAP-like repeat-containing protein [Streptomyces sporangiiformans]TPQ21732.1 integrin-like protein [Streptomyces sporangiiformans]
MRIPLSACAALAAAALTGALLTATGTATAAPSGLVGDFNGDGYQDAAAGSPFATAGGKFEAGSVAVAYGSATGIGTKKSVNQNTSGVPGSAEEGDGFGRSTAVGDLNNDGYSDLAVGAPYEDVSGDTNGGTVVIVWGSASGLSGATTVKDPAVSQHDYWGAALAIADFTGDGRADLAVGASGTTQWIIKGGFTKAGATGSKTTYSTPFSSADFLRLTSGNVNGDGKADLVVTAGKKLSSERYLHRNFLYYGTTSAPTRQLELPYGRQIAIGDLDQDGYGDIVTGETEDATEGDLGSKGTTAISYGTATGVESAVELSDGPYGRPSIGDIDADGFPDLAVGSPVSDAAAWYAGAVLVHYGTADGLGSPVTLTQNTPGIPGAAETNDFFGTATLLTDITGDGHADLVVGADTENDGNGLLTFLMGSADGITTSGAANYGPSAFSMSTAYYPQLGMYLAG